MTLKNKDPITHYFCVADEWVMKYQDIYSKGLKKNEETETAAPHPYKPFFLVIFDTNDEYGWKKFGPYFHGVYDNL